MALWLESGATSRWRGLSTDKKPGEPGISDDQPVRVGSIVTETDTGDRYVWRGSWPWVLQEVTISVLFAELMVIEEEQLRVLRQIRQATATTANAMAQTSYSTDDE